MMKKNIEVKINVDRFSQSIHNLDCWRTDIELQSHHRLLKYINNCILRALDSVHEQNRLDQKEKNISLAEASSRQMMIDQWKKRCNNFPKWKEPRIVVHLDENYFGIWDKKKEVYARYDSKVNDRIKLCDKCCGFYG